MLDKYHDDSEMARYGREQVKYRAIKTAKEGIRDCASRILSYRDYDDIKNVKIELDAHMDNLFKAMELSNK